MLVLAGLALALQAQLPDEGLRLLLAARAARLTQDSALRSYDATAHQRMSVFAGVGSEGRQRLVFRNEGAARIQWKRDVGAWIDMRGARAAIPMAPAGMAREEMQEGDVNDSPMSPVPYYQGYEQLWIGGRTGDGGIEVALVNPLADGAESSYTYEAGDSVTFRLPDGSMTRLRELKVRPRSPAWNLAVGSLWIDVATGQLVRAAYRLAVPVDVITAARSQDPTALADMPGVLRALVGPIVGQISMISVEYGLHEGRFWLPRARVADGTVQASLANARFRVEQRFRYAGINTIDSLPPIIIPAQAGGASCPDSAAGRTVVRERYGSVRLRVGLRYPCDVSTIENGSELAPSIYDAAEDLFGAEEREDIVAAALGLGAQSPMFGRLPRPVVRYGLQLMRYNRVEGLSVGVGARQELGGGLAADGTARFGFADREPRVELFLSRSNMATTIRLGAYNRLASASEWGRPFSFSSSVAAFLFGRDEAFYYRATGGEVSGTTPTTFGRAARLDWRVFLEDQRTARQRTDRSASGDFPANIVATNDTYAGGGLALHHARGLDPRGFRMQSTLRLEAAASRTAYGRAAAELAATDGFGPLAGALAVAAGTSTGALPSQRRWFIGGSHTVRGQSADTAYAGNAFWLTRAEVGTGPSVARVAVFGDVGWTGDRARMRSIGRPASGVGVGTSFADGLFRIDIARGLHPRRQWRVDVMLDAHF